jgi:hypothetical protein
MSDHGYFPFGQPVLPVKLIDRSSKRIFVLGVYASAVHAQWIDAKRKSVVKALAVASEPYIFWKGENSEDIISRIQIPEKLGRLEPADAKFNGPSGITLDRDILEPLGLSRADAWLCDLVPHSCQNPQQRVAIKRAYIPRIRRHDLVKPSVPEVPKTLTDDPRREEILTEILESQASTLILLGDQPIKWFLSHFDSRWHRLSDFGGSTQKYGQLHKVSLNGLDISILPLAHPRQISALGTTSGNWAAWHRAWVRRARPMLA